MVQGVTLGSTSRLLGLQGGRAHTHPGRPILDATTILSVAAIALRSDGERGRCPLVEEF